jgi:hypothetical protein
MSLKAQTEKEKIWQVITQMETSIATKDSIQLKKLLHTDFVGISSWGWLFLKDDYISFHCRKDYGSVAITPGNINDSIIRIYGNTAIVNRQTLFQRKDPGGGQVMIRRIEVLIKEADQWLIISGQGTEINAVPR